MVERHIAAQAARAAAAGAVQGALDPMERDEAHERVCELLTESFQRLYSALMYAHQIGMVDEGREIAEALGRTIQVLDSLDPEKEDDEDEENNYFVCDSCMEAAWESAKMTDEDHENPALVYMIARRYGNDISSHGCAEDAIDGDEDIECAQ